MIERFERDIGAYEKRARGNAKLLEGAYTYTICLKAYLLDRLGVRLFPPTESETEKATQPRTGDTSLASGRINRAKANANAPRGGGFFGPIRIGDVGNRMLRFEGLEGKAWKSFPS